jgi:hypothetical protein
MLTGPLEGAATKRPPCATEGIDMPIIPARLFLDLVERGMQANQISLQKAAHIAKGLPTWLVEDVMGLLDGRLEQSDR